MHAFIQFHTEATGEHPESRTDLRASLAFSGLEGKTAFVISAGGDIGLAVVPRTKAASADMQCRSCHGSSGHPIGWAPRAAGLLLNAGVDCVLGAFIETCEHWIFNRLSGD
jgi:hypothetical protein